MPPPPALSGRIQPPAACWSSPLLDPTPQAMKHLSEQWLDLPNHPSTVPAYTAARPVLSPSSRRLTPELVLSPSNQGSTPEPVLSPLKPLLNPRANAQPPGLVLDPQDGAQPPEQCLTPPSWCSAP